MASAPFRALWPSFLAGGTIAPARIVKLSTAADRTALQAAAGDLPIGVAQEGQKRSPGLPGSDTTIAAEAGDEFNVYGDGEVAVVEAGAAVTRGDWLKSDANGKAITAAPASGIAYMLGRALQSAGGAGEKIKALILIGQVTP
jgi:hypothetical protein